jgi:hypothetical protein
MSLTAERLGRGADDLLGRNVAHVLSEPPAVTEGVCDLPVSVSPERIPERVQNFRSSSYRTFPEAIHILDIKVQNGGCATHALRREDAHLGELIGHHHRRVAEPEFDAHELVAGQGYAARSSAPRAAVYHSAARAASRTTMWGVMVCIPSGIAFALCWVTVVLL